MSKQTNHHVSNNNSKGLFRIIPNEIIFDQILPHFEYKWVLETARLVCKCWNENHRAIPTFFFPIRYSGNAEKMIVMVNEHSDELHKVTELIATKSNGNLDELERDFASKLTNLKSLTLKSRWDFSIIQEFAKLHNLKKVDLFGVYRFEEFLKTPSKIKSFKVDFSFKNTKEILFDDIDWPLEELAWHAHDLTTKSYVSLLNNKTMVGNLQKCEIYDSLDRSMFKLLENLESVTSLSCIINTERMKHISKLGKLKELKGGSSCDDEAAQYVSQLNNLTHLDLHDNVINGSGLSNFGNLTNITTLYLNNNSIENEGANYLSSLINLNTLHLNSNKISDEGLTNYYKLSKLTDLTLAYNQIGSVGANYLSKVTNLTSLTLNENVIGEEGLENFGNLHSLRNLNLNLNKIRNGFQYLSGCASLTYLDVESNEIPGKSVIKFSEKNPPITFKQLPHWQ